MRVDWSAAGAAGQAEETHMDLVVQRSRIYRRAVCAPRHARHRAPDLEYPDGLLAALVSALPHAHRPVVRSGGDELDACAACDGAVERVDDLAVRTKAAHARARREIRVRECVVRGDGVEEGVHQGPLQIHDGGLVRRRKEAIIGVGRVRPPEGYVQNMKADMSSRA